MKPDSQYYRPDIDGLRGIAVLFVLAFHGFSSILPGGFIGVDVFFVISGYLISSIIFKDILDGRFSIARFYERRIKRIFPALITVLVAALALAWFFLFPTEYKNLGKHVVGGATFTSNIMLWRETGYFDPAAELKPLLHLWSLGVEEQFYIFFPISIWFAHRMGLAKTRFLVIIFCFSFALSSWGTVAHPSATFYLPVTRLWELLVGCTLASMEMESRRLSPGGDGLGAGFGISGTKQMFRNMVSWLGMAMIIGTAFFLSTKSAFPGWWALIPTLGTVFVIYAGKSSFLNNRIFGNKLLVGVGLISYPLYLWHWPLLSFARTIWPEKISNLMILGILTVSAVLASVTYWFIERPMRFGASAGAKKVFQLCSGMIVILIVSSLTMLKRVPSRIGLTPLGNQIDLAVSDWHYPFHDNLGRLADFTIDAEIGLSNAEPATLFVGDSLMQHYWPRVEYLLTNSPGNSRPVIFLTSGGSPSLPGVNRIKPGYASNKFFEYAITQASKPNVGTVVFGCFWDGYFIGCYPDLGASGVYRISDPTKSPLRLDSASADQVFSEYGQVIARLVSMRKEVIVLLPSPSSSWWAPIAWLPRLPFSDAHDSSRSRISRRDLESFVFPVKKKLTSVVVSNGGKVVDPFDFFVDGGFFHGRNVDGEFLYLDAAHMRPFYVKERATFLDSLVLLTGKDVHIGRQ